MATIAKYGKVIFTTDDLNFIRANWPTMTNPELATALGVKLTRLRNELHGMGLKRMEMEYWTLEQVDFLKSNYRQIGDMELAEYFEATWPKQKPWTKKHIEKKRNYLDLHRTDEELIKIHARNTKAGRFQICAVKRWAKSYQSPIGDLRLWNKTEGGHFVVIKTAEGWKHHNRWLWEQHHGKLTSDQLVVPKNGFQLLCELEDLEVINREEHAFRNSTRRAKYSPEIKEIMKLTKALKKQIKQSKSC